MGPGCQREEGEKSTGVAQAGLWACFAGPSRGIGGRAGKRGAWMILGRLARLQPMRGREGKAERVAGPAGRVGRLGRNPKERREIPFLFPFPIFQPNFECKFKSI